MKTHKISFRADDALYQGLKAVAERRGLSLSDYLRLMASLELVDRIPDPQPSLDLDLELKDVVAAMASYAERPPRHRLTTLQRAIEAILAAQDRLDAAARWLVTVAEGEEALSRATRRSRPPLDS
jgi:predicted transcriptional regulator